MKNTTSERSNAAPIETVQDIIANRDKEYGGFTRVAVLSQILKDECQTRMEGYTRLAPDQRESLAMILHKIARIITGNCNNIDSWKDIAGYALLISNRLEKETITK